MTNETEKEFPHALIYGLVQNAPQNYDDAIKHLEGGAIEKIADTRFNLGVMYHKGLDIPKNYAKALKWYYKASEENHAKAKNNLGVMYEKEQGVLNESEKAKEYYRQAAELGEVYAQYNFGFLYCNPKEIEDEEVSINFTQAYKWVSISIANGFYMGNRLLEEIETKMSPTDIRMAQELAEKCWSEFKLKKQSCPE